MREIKFRIFDKQEEEFLNEEDYAINFVGTIFKACLDEEVFEVLDADMYIVTQYTGLKAKNDVEIYEGDIVIVENYNHHGKNPNKVMFVYYDNLTAQYCTKIEKTNCKIEDLIMENQPLCFAHSIEIIGNIYENKELLNTDG